MTVACGRPTFEMIVPDHIFRAYDIRGTYGQDLTEGVAGAVGWALGSLAARRRSVDNPRVVVGMDARLHSPALRDACASGLAASGARCLLLGLCPSPLTYYAAHVLKGIDAFVVVTGSHNPPEENGFKPGIGTDSLHSGDISLIRDLARQAPEINSSDDPPAKQYDIVSHYIEDLSARFAHLKQSTRRPDGKVIKVVLDSGNGTAGPVLPPIMRAAGIEVVELFSTPDGRFPNHHPDPTLPDTLEALSQAVDGHGADLGMAFDGDADRVGVVDETGKVIWGDMLLLALARDLIRNTGDADPPLVISEVKASQLLYSGVEEAGGRAMMWKTGHSLIKARMKETGALLAGEMSGHLFFADRYYGFDDALYAAMRIVETYAGALGRGEVKGFSGLLKGLPRVYATPEIRFPCHEDEKFSLVEAFRGWLHQHTETGNDPVILEIIDVDGVRVRFKDGWGLLRASNTQPVLVMRFEARLAAQRDRYRGFFQKALKRLQKGTSR